MTPPDVLSRIAGFWPVTLLLFAGYGYIGYAWYAGHVRFWPALITLGFAVATFKALLRVSRYRKWQATWERMGEPDDAAPPKSGGGKAIIFGVVAVLAGIPPLVLYVVKNRYHAEELGALWCAVAAGVVLVNGVRLARFSWRGYRMRSDEKALAASVSWTIGRAAASPSWKAARRQVPDYARQVLRGRSAPRLERAKPDALKAN